MNELTAAEMCRYRASADKSDFVGLELHLSFLGNTKIYKSNDKQWIKVDRDRAYGCPNPSPENFMDWALRLMRGELV